MDSTSGGPILIFDGVCNICSFGVGIVLRADRHRRFRFAFAQGEVGGALKRRFGLPDGDLESVALVEDGRVWTRSDAALAVMRRLPWPWPLGLAFAVLPRPLRDALYLMVARNRYRWFGKRAACFIPPPEAMPRFLDRP